MKYSVEHIRFLWEQYLNKKASPAEIKALFAMLKDEANEERSVSALQDAMSKHALLDELSKDQREFILNKVLGGEPVDAIEQDKKPAADNLSSQLPVHRVHFIRRAWFRYAAVLLLVVGSAALLYRYSPWLNNDPVLAEKQLLEPQDIGPGTEKALLTLSDGTTIVLDSINNGAIARQGNAEVIKLGNGQIVYDLKGRAGKEAMWNTMTTPRGGQYSLVLPDGTKVWLNAASSITYPAVFVDTERKVKVNGEAYFEVAKNKEKPFIVDVDGRSVVQVLGTSFNINAYADEPFTRTTLLEGSLRVSSAEAKAAALIRPGQEAAIAHTATATKGVVVSDADIQEALAWKNGLFHFNDADLSTVVRQLEKWYDISVRFEGEIPDVQLIGEMKRGVKLSTILTWFSDLGIKTRLEGRNLIIL